MRAEEWARSLIGQTYLADFLRYTISTPHPMDTQETAGKLGENFWCSDWWHIEVIRCLYLGTDEYLMSPIPSQYKNNEYFVPKENKFYADMKYKILESLEQVRNSCSSLFIPMVGRGIDILLANLIKKWETIYCNDNQNVSKYLKDQFTNQVVYYNLSNNGIVPEMIGDRSILIMNVNRPKFVEILHKAGKIQHYILLGEIQW